MLNLSASVITGPLSSHLTTSPFTPTTHMPNAQDTCSLSPAPRVKSPTSLAVPGNCKVSCQWTQTNFFFCCWWKQNYSKFSIKVRLWELARQFVEQNSQPTDVVHFLPRNHFLLDISLLHRCCSFSIQVSSSLKNWYLSHISLVSF